MKTDYKKCFLCRNIHNHKCICNEKTVCAFCAAKIEEFLVILNFKHSDIVKNIIKEIHFTGIKNGN